MRRREFVAGVTGVIGGAAGSLAWQRLRAGQSEPVPEPKLPSPEPPPPTIPEFARLSFSQQGEDIVLYHALHDLLKIDRPTYMDVGAAHPVRSNNTYLLYGTGSTGVLVEPNPMYVEMLRRQRPKDTVVAAGIGVTDAAEADYYEIKGNPLLNTFSSAQVTRLQKGQSESVVARISKMPLVNINRAITDHLGKAPDLLSTDIEGLDYAIVRTLDLRRFRPGVICCEGVPFDTKNRPSAIVRYLTLKGYILRGGSMVNSVFVDRNRVDD